MFLGMEKETIIAISVGVLCGVCVLFFLKSLLKGMAEHKKAEEELFDENVEEIPIIFEDATVLSKRSDIVYGKGIKTPTHRVAFFVTFSVNGNGMEKELEVPEETFTAVVKNESATLITRDGQFLDFGECDLKAD